MYARKDWKWREKKEKVRLERNVHKFVETQVKRKEISKETWKVRKVRKNRRQRKEIKGDRRNDQWT